MPSFTCQVCGQKFNVPETLLAKYPNWQPSFCKQHHNQGAAIYTDGSASPNPGTGGWAAIKIINDKIVNSISGGEVNTTNNRMELMAVINAFKMIEKNEKIVVYSDSNLCVQTINIWAKTWEKRGWKKKQGEIKNLDLVKEAHALFKSNNQVELKWVQSHVGHKWNELVDEMAKKSRSN